MACRSCWVRCQRMFETRCWKSNTSWKRSYLRVSSGFEKNYFKNDHHVTSFNFSVTSSWILNPKKAMKFAQLLERIRHVASFQLLIQSRILRILWKTQITIVMVMNKELLKNQTNHFNFTGKLAAGFTLQQTMVTLFGETILSSRQKFTIWKIILQFLSYHRFGESCLDVRCKQSVWYLLTPMEIPLNAAGLTQLNQVWYLLTRTMSGSKITRIISFHFRLRVPAWSNTIWLDKANRRILYAILWH